MADIAISGEPNFPDLVPTKKGRSRKALKPKTSPSNDTNILPVEVSQSPIIESTGKENEKKAKKKATKGASKTKPQEGNYSFEKEFEEMQKKLEQMTLAKEKTEEMLKEKEEALKLKEKELETRGREQDKLQMELKKLGKMKEFKPTMNFPLVQAPKEKEQGKKEKKKACPEKKRPSPPYALWLKDQWTEVKKENPDAEFKEISSMLAAKWKMVTAEEKKPYEEKYQAEKEAYLKIIGAEKRENEAMKLLEEEQKQRTAMELLEQYMQFKKEETENDMKKKTKKEKDPLKPKHPVTAFFLFMNERRADLVAEKKSVLEVGKITGEEWKNMPVKEKAPYEEMAKKNKEQYLQQMEVYKKKKDEEAASLQKEEEELSKLQKQEALQLLKKKEKTENLIKKTKEGRQKKQKAEKKIVDPNKPKRPASSFFLFSKEARKTISEERPGINNSTLNALISVKWKEISQEEKQLWNEKAAGAMEAYKKEMEEYNKTAAAEESSSSCSGQQ